MLSCIQKQRAIGVRLASVKGCWTERMLHVGRLSPRAMTTWVPTAFRTHTLGELQANGAELIDTEVTVIGFMEANRGKGAICFVDLRDLSLIHI